MQINAPCTIHSARHDTRRGADPSKRASERVDRCILFYMFVNSLHSLSSSPEHIFTIIYDLFQFISIITTFHLSSINPFFIVFFLLLETLALTGAPHRTIESPTKPAHTHTDPAHRLYPTHTHPIPSIHLPPPIPPPHFHHLVNDPGTTARCTVRLYQGFNFQAFSRPCRL